MTELKPLRRIVTALDAAGKSFHAADTDAPSNAVNPANPNRKKYNVWATGPLPVPFQEPDRFAEVKGICPIVGGSVMHVLDIPPLPKDPDERAAFVAKQRDDQAKRPHMPGVKHHHGADNVGMHETETIDYAIVLFGEIYSVLDKDEMLLKQGDILIQRGTSHAWVNRSDDICRIAFILVTAKP